MRFYAIPAIRVAVLAVGLALPRTAAAQVLAPSDRPMTFTVRFAPDVARPVALARGETAAPPTPRTKPHGPLFIRLAGGFIVGERIADLALTVTGFAVVAGVVFPIAHREDMEIQVDISYLKYSGRSTDPAVRLSLDGSAVGPTALYLYNFVREGRSVMPFVGGGVNLAHINETETLVVLNPFTFESTTTEWLVNPQAVGGAQFASKSRVTFRAEGRLSLGSSGPQFLVLGGISF